MTFSHFHRKCFKSFKTRWHSYNNSDTHSVSFGHVYCSLEQQHSKLIIRTTTSTVCYPLPSPLLPSLLPPLSSLSLSSIAALSSLVCSCFSFYLSLFLVQIANVFNFLFTFSYFWFKYRMLFFFFGYWASLLYTLSWMLRATLFFSFCPFFWGRSCLNLRKVKKKNVKLKETQCEVGDTWNDEAQLGPEINSRALHHMAHVHRVEIYFR